MTFARCHRAINSTTQQTESSLCGANLCALTKKDGGVRPIAVGCTFRRMIAKVAVRRNCKYADTCLQYSLLLASTSVKISSKASVHAIRCFIMSFGPGNAMQKCKNRFHASIQHFVVTLFLNPFVQWRSNVLNNVGVQTSTWGHRAGGTTQNLWVSVSCLTIFVGVRTPT
jgi:hypothetical protein